MRRWLLTPLVAGLFIISFIESWAALVHAATSAGIPYPRPWPLVVDGFIVAMALSIIEADRERGKVALWPRVGLLVATALSTGIQAAWAPQEDWAWALHAWSPLAVLFSFECLVWLWRPSWEPAPTPSAHPQPATVPAPAGPPSGPEHLPASEPSPPMRERLPGEVQTRPKAAQGAPRSARPAALGRPTAWSPTDDPRIEALLDEGLSPNAVRNQLGLTDKQYRKVLAFRDQRQLVPSRNGDGS